MEDEKKQNSTGGNLSVIISWYQRLTKGEKISLKVYIVWFLIHCVLLVAGDNRDGFFPWDASIEDSIEYWDLVWWRIDYYGLPEFIVYVALIPIILYYAYSFYKGKKR